MDPQYIVVIVVSLMIICCLCGMCKIQRKPVPRQLIVPYPFQDPFVQSPPMYTETPPVYTS